MSKIARNAPFIAIQFGNHLRILHSIPSDHESLPHRSFKPDFLLVRQNLRDASEDHRNLLLGFQYAQVPSVNSLESIYNFQVRENLTFHIGKYYDTSCTIEHADK